MTAPGRRRFGFSAVVGQDDLKLALMLAAIDPAIGGVLLRGDKGAGKTTLARAFAALLPGEAPFVELPLGATEDRVLGSIDLAAALADGTERARPGLLAAAHGGVLYVDEVNLLADHLVDTLLDVAVSGEHRLERDGVSVVHPARFVLVGTMNPEEGELRPQLLDRFGLCVAVSAPPDPETRAEIVRRRLAFDTAAPAGAGGAADPEDRELARRLAAARPAALDDGTIAFASRLAVAAGAEGVRADIVLCRAAAALAGWEGRATATPADVERVAPLALAHRHRRSPLDPPILPPESLTDALDRARSETDAARDPAPPPPPSASPDADAPDAPAPPPPEPPSGDGPAPGDGGRQPIELGEERASPGLPPTPPDGRTAGPSGRRAPAPSARGRTVRDEPFRPDAPGGVAVAATVRQVARRRAADPDGDRAAQPGDLRSAVRQDRTGTLVVIALDTSGSMGARERVRAATGAVLGLLTDAYQRRDRVAVVTFAGEGARVALAPTGSVEVARNRLAALETGGTTPLGAGLATGLQVATRQAAGGERSVLVAVTDGRATGGEDAAAEALAAAAEVRAAGVPALVLDAETGVPRLGLATRLAEAMGAACRPLADLTPGTLQSLT